MTEGSKVVCVNGKFPGWALKLYNQLPVEGVTYTVRAVYPGRGKLVGIKGGKLIPNAASESSPEIGILLVELTNPPDPFCQARELGFNAERFTTLQSATETAADEIEQVDTAAAPQPVLV